MAGSLGLNKRFEEAFKAVVGEDQFFRLRKTKGFEEAVSQFDKSIKVAFRGGVDEEYYVNFPMANLRDDPLNNIQANCWNMKGYLWPIFGYYIILKRIQSHPRSDISTSYKRYFEIGRGASQPSESQTVDRETR